MAKSKNVLPPATNTEVRAFFAENPALVPDGDKSVGAASAGRGRVSAPARAAFTEATGREALVGRKPEATVALSYVHVQPSGRKVTKVANVSPKDLRALVPNAPERGVLSKAHLAAAGEAYAKQVSA